MFTLECEGPKAIRTMRPQHPGLATLLWLPTVVAFLLALGVGGCDSKTPPAAKDNPTPAATKDKVYDIKGKVLKVESAKKRIMLDHEDIPGLMEAMKMWLDVEDAKILDGLKEGDQVQGRLKVPDGKYLITELKKI